MNKDLATQSPQLLVFVMGAADDGNFHLGSLAGIEKPKRAHSALYFRCASGEIRTPDDPARSWIRCVANKPYRFRNVYRVGQSNQ